MQTIPYVSPSELNLQPFGAEFEKAPESYLKGQLEIGASYFHVDFVEVAVAGDGVVSAVIGEFEARIKVLHEMLGDAPGVQEYNDRTYVVFVYPFAA